jgi:DNA-binding NarL/FixJ family response regulator
MRKVGTLPPMDKPQEIRIAIVEDDDLIRESLQLILNGTPGFTADQTFSSADDFLKSPDGENLDVILMDIKMPGLSGIECVRLLKERGVETPVLMLTIQEDEESIFQSLQAGAVGYLIKNTPPSDLLKSIEEMHNGGAPISPSIARKVVAFFHPNKTNPLSEREIEVLDKLCQGENNKAIADALFVSTNTVKAHIKSIYQKLHVNSRGGAVSKAIKDRLV